MNLLFSNNLVIHYYLSLLVETTIILKKQGYLAVKLYL
jgi:hypothetical protein